MPIYEYQCAACGHQMDAFQKMTDAPLTDCPKCHAPALNKLVSAAGFQLKGSGWYATDYRDKARPKSAENNGTGEQGTAPESSETKTNEAKTETKTSTSSTKDSGTASS